MFATTNSDSPVTDAIQPLLLGKPTEPAHHYRNKQRGGQQPSRHPAARPRAEHNAHQAFSGVRKQHAQAEHSECGRCVEGHGDVGTEASEQQCTVHITDNGQEGDQSGHECQRLRRTEAPPPADAQQQQRKSD